MSFLSIPYGMRPCILNWQRICLSFSEGDFVGGGANNGANCLLELSEDLLEDVLGGAVNIFEESIIPFFPNIPN